VKVWFQNRRTKQKKDQSRESEKRGGGGGPSSTSEAFATCNLLRLLEQGRLLSVPAPPALLPATSHPVGATPGNGPPSPGLGRAESPPATGGFSLQVASLAASAPSSRLPTGPLCFGSPLAGSLHKLPAGYGLGPSAFEPYTRLERKDSPPRCPKPPSP
ncbi:hypothetical protein E2320_022667, partial [Naja naja]